VQVASNSDTSFSLPIQTVESKGTTATFGGLTSNTTYRVRVTARYSGAAGALSTNHTIGTFTLNASGAISDGIAPTTNPVITSAMVKSLFGAFAITFPPVVNPDDVKYEVFIKPTNATGIVDNQYKVLEVGGTFAVVKTLADRTTALSYGTNYYIAVRAKDNDGVSTGTVDAVGPVTTLQVANADLAADSVYANNIKAGEIDATKLTSDTVLANQKITVGSNSALDRIRLDATNATVSAKAVSSRIYIGGGNYYDTASPFYADNLGRLSIGQSLKFEDGALTINGSGTFTGTVTAGAGLNIVKLGTDVNGTNDGIYIGATGDYIYSDGTLRLGNGGIIYSGGVLSVTGNIEASSIKATADLSGLSITGTSGTIGGITLNSSGLSSTNFSISSTGLITANGGTIGGWTINSTQLRSSAADGPNRSYISLNPTTPKIALITGATFTSGVPSGGTELTIDPVNGIVGPSVTVAGNTGPGFSFSPNGTAVLRGTIYASSGVFSGTVSGATIQTSNSSYIRMDSVSPSEIQLHANGFAYDGTFDFGGGTSNGKSFGSLVIQAPSSNPYHKPALSLDDSSGISLESYNKIYFSVSRPVIGTNDTSELNVFAYMEQYGAEGAYQGRFNFEANIPVADKSFRPIFAGTTSLPDAAFPNEEIGSIYLEY
jgi:hypothetical protein